MTTQVAERLFKSPLPKLVAFFRRSRDGWKAKHQELKRKFKYEQNQRWAVEKSRQKWRQQCELAQQRVAELEQELAAAKNGVWHSTE